MSWYGCAKKKDEDTKTESETAQSAAKPGTIMGSRHLRVMVAGPYTGDGTFETIEEGQGFQAEQFGHNNGTFSGSLMTFKATAAGLATKTFSVDGDGVLSGTPTTTWGGAAGTTEPTAFTYDATDAEKAAFLKTGLGSAYTSGDEWHLANGPLSFESVAIDGK